MKKHFETIEAWIDRLNCKTLELNSDVQKLKKRINKLVRRNNDRANDK